MSIQIECDCEALALIENEDDIKTFACKECHKTWFGCGVMCCKHPVDFQTREEVLEHIAKRHEEDL